MDDEYYFVYLSMEVRSLFMTVVKREIKGFIRDLNSSRKEVRLRVNNSESEEGGQVEELAEFTFVAWV